MPTTGRSSRHQMRRRGGPGRTDDAERFDDHTAQREQGHGHRGRGHRDGDEGGEPGRRVEVGGEDAALAEADAADQGTADGEEAGAQDQSDEGAGQRLTGRDAAHHPAVGADQPQRGEPAVAPLAAEADGGGDEHGDGHQQGDEGQDDHQHEDGVEAVAFRVVAEGGDAVDAVVVGAALGEAVAAQVEEQFAGPDQPRVADGLADRPVQPLAQQGPVGGLQQLVQGGGDGHLARAGDLLQAGRQRGLRALGPQRVPLDVLAAVRLADPGDEQGVGPGGVGPRGAHRRPCVAALVARGQGAGDGRADQQQRDAETDADTGEQGADPPLAAAAEGEAGAHAEVAGPCTEPAHTIRSMSRDLPSRTTISRSE